MFAVVIIFIFVCIWKTIKNTFFCHDFSDGLARYQELQDEVREILGNVRCVNVGSTSTGISIGSSDTDIGIFVQDVEAAESLLIKAGFRVTGRSHFINLTRHGKNEVDVKIYLEEKELIRLEKVIGEFKRTVWSVSRYWIISEKIWYNYIRDKKNYSAAKLRFAKKYFDVKDS